MHPHSTTFYKSGWAGWIPPRLLMATLPSSPSPFRHRQNGKKKGRDNFSNNFLVFLFSFFYLIPRVSPFFERECSPSSFSFLFLNPFLSPSSIRCISTFLVLTVKKKENDYVSEEGVECVRPWPIPSAKWFISRLYKCLKTACFGSFFFFFFPSLRVDRRRIYIGNGVVAIPRLLAVGTRRYNHVLKLIEDLS